MSDVSELPDLRLPPSGFCVSVVNKILTTHSLSLVRGTEITENCSSFWPKASPNISSLCVLCASVVIYFFLKPSFSSLPSVNFYFLPSIPKQHHQGRARQDLEIQARAPVVDVGQVHLHPFLEGDLVAPRGGLPDAREPRLHRQAPALPGFVLRHLGRNRRPRPHQAHLAAQHKEFVSCAFLQCRPYREMIPGAAGQHPGLVHRDPGGYKDVIDARVQRESDLVIGAFKLGRTDGHKKEPSAGARDFFHHRFLVVPEIAAVPTGNP